ncbi:MAG TPA: MG2 domain-containing protein [Edaphobacter sp.]|nr:MG2 domain-containing protein [Edaphobacter sp.]
MRISRSCSFLSFLVPFVLVVVVAAGILSFAHARTQQLAATYSHRGLSVTIPYQSIHAGSGRLVTEILDPEDHVLGRVERVVDIAKGDGSWQQVVTPEKPIPFDDIIWQRMRYRFEYNDSTLPAIEGIESISQILRRPVVHILGQTQYLAGSEAAIRVIVSDANSDIAESGTLRIELLIPNQSPRLLFSGRLNRRGTVEAQFRFPTDLAGKYEMRYLAETPIGATEFTQPIQLEEKASILLTTEKPIYQPGQTIHVRLLALDRSNYKAESDRKLTFELEDSRGNKVFKKSTTTDKFGVASTEFSLADEVNLGTYHLRALIGEPSAPTSTSEIAINVERYVLPRFKVAVEFSEKDNKPKRDYRPGDHVIGTVRANYFFGKPVEHAEISVKASSMDVAVFEAASIFGTTDNDGVFHFDLKLPTYFAGRPLNQGVARALVEAVVKDSAAHSETRGEPITISKSSLLITAVPEGGTLIPHIENQVFILSSYPDGTPANTSLTIRLPSGDQQVSTDSGGVAVVRFNPGPGTESLRVEADDHHGNRTSTDVPLQTRSGTDQILLRTSRSVFKTGDRIQLKVFSTRASGSVYVDVVKNGQTILTRDLDLQNGQADLTLNATQEMAGTLDIDAYLFGRDAQPVADRRLIFVQPADELKIETTSDAPVYKPGSDARVNFHVTNSRGEGVSAALGLQIVDEAVFALAEKQPGFAKVFFYLEQEVMKPRYEIHSLSMENVVEPADSSNDHHELAARALFAATEMANPAKLDTEFGRSLPQDKYAEYQQRYHAVFIEQVSEVAAKLSRNLEEHPADEDIIAAFAKVTLSDGSRPHDSWNTPFRIEPTGWSQGRNHFYRIRSAGPDREFDNADDLTAYIEERSGSIIHQPGRGDSLDVKIEHDRGPFGVHADVTGTVIDQTGAVIPGATITLHQRFAQNTRTARSNASGQFTFAGVPVGRYQVDITAPGFLNILGGFSLQPRDRAVLSATLAVANVTETVMVAGAVPLRVTEEMVAMGGPVSANMPLAQNFQAGIAVRNGAVGGLAIEGRSFAAVLKAASTTAPHVRSYFPEALYINPEIITDAKGNASVSVPIADSITTWRMAMLASTQSGALGSSTSSLKVFQDFFVELDLPVTLTQGDRVSIPVAIYNYSGKPGEVSLKLQPEDWFELDNDSSEKTVRVEAGRVGSSSFTLSTKRIGKFKLTLSARMNGDSSRDERQDIVVREIEVIPNGRERNLVFNGRLETSAQHDLHFPVASIPDATSILVRLYPGPLSQVIEGMDSILSMPGGCFEQTSSSTYPNVLALDYMKRTKKLTPEVHAKAEGYIANGYQRLLTFEVPGGGFSWFGQAPANKILTAYGLMEFNDMSKVSDVDPRLIERTRDWLAHQQQPAGSWQPDTSFINEGATNRYNSDVLRITAYIAWSLANTGYQGPAVERAKQFIESHSNSKPDPYTLALIANFAADYGKDRDFTRQSMQALIDVRTEKDDQVYWTVEETGVYSTGSSAAIETTGLATQALLKWGQASETARKALNFISSKKQASGNWGTTQATIMALRSLLLASQLSTSDVRGSLQVILNDKPVETLKLTPENNDLLHQFVFKNIDAQKSVSVQLKFEGTGGLAYQVVGRYFTPWDEKPALEPLSIDVAYDRTKLAQNDIATATVTVRNNLPKTANMVMVDLGIPPGFDLLSEDLQSFQEKSAGVGSGRLEKFSLTATQAILYFNALSPKQTVTLNFRLRAKYPIRARTFQSRVYEYYDPDVNSTARPIQLEVRDR